MVKPIYFSFKELVESETAEKKGIDNTPTWEVVDHLKELALFLDGLRYAWGSAINVSSGYRCEELNKAAKGSKTSMHKAGYAADLYPANGKFDEFVKFVRKWLDHKQYDQALIEKNSKGSRWLHIGLYNNSGEQRRICKELEVL